MAHLLTEQKAFTIYLKEDRNWWYRVISEIWAGKVIAEATRDINAVAQAIQNTLLIDALIGWYVQAIMCKNLSPKNVIIFLSIILIMRFGFSKELFY